jgi:predicted site-specific integrase-resolvase
MKNKTPSPEWISESEAAEQMGYKPKTLRRYAQTGKLSIAFTKVNYKTVEYNRLDIVAHKMSNSSITNPLKATA